MRRAARIAAGGLAGALLLGALLWASSALLLEAGVAVLTRATGGRLQVEGARPTPTGGFRVAELRWSDAAQGLSATVRDVRVALGWRALLSGEIRVDTLDADVVDVLLPVSDAPAAMPASLRLPVPLEVREARLARLVIRQHDSAPVEVGDLRLAGRYAPGGYTVEGLSLASRHGRVTLAGRIGDEAPFALRATAAVKLAQDLPLAPGAALVLAAEGDLQEVLVDAQVSPRSTPTDRASSSMPVRAVARVRPFDAAPLRRVEATLKGLDLAQWSASGMPRSAIDGDVEVTPIADVARGIGLEARLRLANAGPDALAGGLLPSARLDARLRWREGRLAISTSRLEVAGAAAALEAIVQDGRVTIARARLSSPSRGSATLSGTAALAAPHALDLAGTFALGPSGADMPSGRWSVRGPAGALLDGQGRGAAVGPVDVDVHLDSGRLEGLPTRGSVAARVSRTRIAALEADLGVGPARLVARGALGAADDEIAFGLRAAAIGPLARLVGGVRMSGGIAVEGTLRGPVDAPSALSLRADARDLVAGDLAIGRLRAELTGSAASHAVRVDVAGARLSGELTATGVLVPGGGWRGTLATLRGVAPVSLRLVAPAAVSWSAGRLELTDLTLEGDFGRFRAPRIVRADGRTELEVDAALSRLGALSAALGFPTASAEADAQLDALSLQLRAVLSGTSAADLSGQVEARLSGQAGSAGTGRLALGIRAGALAGTLDLRLPTLAFANRIVGPEWAVDGRLAFDGRVGGSLVAPRLDGALSGEALRFEQRALGWRLGDGTLTAVFEGDRLSVKSLRLRSPGAGGGAELRGEVTAGGTGRFEVLADRLVVPIGPGQRIVLSGRADVSGTADALELRGRLRADEGRIELGGGDAPTLPDDVVVKGRPDGKGAPKGVPAAAARSGRPGISADLALAFGDRFRVHGQGLDARLEGELGLRGRLPEAPRVVGAVRVRDGRYQAYGQELEIVSGTVVFNGPVDNPAIDILALRRRQTVEAGVALTGTALSPRVRLASRPEVPDVEKLSWLVLGMPLDNVQSGAQGAALQAAATTLFGRNDGALTGGLARALGLDVLTVRSAAAAGEGLLPSRFGAGVGGALPPVPGQVGTPRSVAGAGAVSEGVVAVGKRLGSGLTVTYEQGLRGVWNLLRIQYDLSRRFSLRAQTGSESAIDLLYRFSFD